MGGLGCDNMTVVLVCLLNEQSYDDLAAKCALPVRKEVLEKYDNLQNEQTPDQDVKENSSCQDDETEVPEEDEKVDLT